MTGNLGRIVFMNFFEIFGDFQGIPKNPRGDWAGTGTTIWSGVLGGKSPKIPAGTGHSGVKWMKSTHNSIFYYGCFFRVETFDK